MMNCIYSCIDSWLPVDGEIHEVLIEDQFVSYLFPVEWTSCPRCNEASYLNPEIREVNV